MKTKKIRVKKSVKKLILTVVLVLIVSLVFWGTFKYLKDTKIERVLVSKSYSYLPVEAKNYIKQVYEETGIVILTEKNKVINKPYLNPLYVDYLKISDEEKGKVGSVPNPTIVDYDGTDFAYGNSFPERYSLSQYVSPVRDQAGLGLCWAFSAASTLETHLLFKSGIQYTAGKQLISERQIDYATAINGINDYSSEYVSFINRELGDGGNFYLSTVALANGVSAYDYGWKVYDDTDLERMELHEVLNFDKSLYEVNSTINMPYLNIKELEDADKEVYRTNYLNLIKESIIENGSAVVATYYSDACLHNEASLNNVILDVEDSCGSSYDGHAMTVIGWDDTIEYDYCADTKYHNDDITNCSNIVRGKGVWLLKNSWGPYNDPYPYLAYDSSYSGFHFITNVSESNKKKWDNNYIVGSKNSVTGATHSLSNTDIVGEEKVELVKFMIDTSLSTVDVKFIDKDDNTSITRTVSTELPGLVTVDFGDDNVIVDKDSKIIISVRDNRYIIDHVSIFTSNLDNDYYIDLSKYDNKNISDSKLRLYSVTRNIPANSTLTYKFVNDRGVDVTNMLTISNNIVAENNINTLVDGFSRIDSGKYTISVSYNGTEVNSITFNNLQMSGSGTQSDPYVIENATHLDQIRNDLDAHYILGNDIDLTEETREGGKFYNDLEGDFKFLGGHGWKPINEFSGSLDGKGYSIKGLYIKSYMSETNDGVRYTARVLPEYIGLFGHTMEDVSIKNLVLEDFDVTCHGECGLLVGHHQDEYGDYEAYDVNFSNIAVKNSKLSLVYDNNSIYAGGVLGSVAGNAKSTLNISNIYADVEINSHPSAKVGGLLYTANSFKETNIKNIQLVGSINGLDDDAYDSAVLMHRFLGYQANIENVLSTINNPEIGANLINNVVLNSNDEVSSKFVAKNLNMMQVGNSGIFYSVSNGSDEFITLSNNKFYTNELAPSALSDKDNFSTWGDLINNWNINNSVDGISRFPVLKFVDFEYTSIPDIYLEHKLNKKVNIYDFIQPNISSAKRISYKSDNEEIVKFDDDGTIIPLSSGSTIIHVESLYDGYIKDVPITVDYEPHYVVNFDANGGLGTMDSVEVSTSVSYHIKPNEFTKEFYIFNGWNTKSDGSGTSYSDLGVVPLLSDKSEITLYAQWLGEEFEVTFYAAGGEVPIRTKTYRYGDLYGELPIPVKDGYGFNTWAIQGDNFISSIYSDYEVNRSYYYRTLVARWVADAYTVVFNQNGGEGITKWMYIKNNTNGTLLENTYTNGEFRFAGWNTEPDGSGTSYSDKAVINLSNVDNSVLTLYAQWDIDDTVIKYESNSGSGNMSDQVIEYGVTGKLTKNSFTRVGYEFTGWNTKADGSGTSYADQASITAKGQSITLYAQWKANKYSVVFNSNGGSGSMASQTFTYDVEQALIENKFSNGDLVFAGWNTKADGSGVSYANKATVKNLTTTGSITLYAKWEEAFTYSIEDFEENKTENYIDKVDALTTVEDYKKKFTLGTGYRVEIDLGTLEHVFTGSKTKIFKNNTLVHEFTNIVRGDIYADGKISALDYVSIRNHIMESEVITDAIFIKAADADFDNRISALDYVTIRTIIMEGAN